jgi:hypothetical protein
MLLAVAAAGCGTPAAAGRPAVDSQQAPARAAEVATLMLRDVDPLHGGQILYLAADGSGYCQLLSHRDGSVALYERRYRLAPSAELKDKLASVLTGPAIAGLGSSSGAALPGTARPALSLRLASGQTVAVQRWQYDKDPAFDAIYQALLAVVKAAPAQKLLAEGRFDMDWVPPGFAETKKN